MPGTPTEEKTTTKTEYGTLPSTIFSVVRQNEAGYLVGYLDFPQNLTLNSSELNQALSAIASGFAEGSRGRLISQETVRLGNFPGREIRLQFERGVIGRGRIYLVNKRLYVVMAITNKESSLTKSIQGFLNSFQLLKQSTAPAKPSMEELNANLRQAICSQNWSQALRVINRMIAIAPNPQTKGELVAYRRQLQGLANSRSRIPAESLPECTSRS